MSSYRQRFVGLTELPRGLSEFDAEHAFGLSQTDLDNIRKFPTKARLAAAAQLVLARATGRSFTHSKVLPTTLLQYLSRTLGVSDTSIASIKALYSREKTLLRPPEMGLPGGWLQIRRGFRSAGAAGLSAVARRQCHLRR